MSVKEVFNNPSFCLAIEEAKENYNLDNTIAKIDSIVSQKVALLIGRTANEALPQEEGTIWVSGDLTFGSSLFSHDRLHLLMDFNDDNLCEKLINRFDIVVIDQSTVKFLDEDFIKRFTSFLKPLPTSTFIFEACPYSYTYSQIEEPINQFSSLLLPFSMMNKEREFLNEIYSTYLFEQNGLDNVKTNNHPYFQSFIEELTSRGKTFENVEKSWEQKFKLFFYQNRLGNESKELSPQQIAFKNAEKNTCEYLKTCFESAVFFQNADYPYPTNFDNKNFYVAIGPKLQNN